MFPAPVVIVQLPVTPNRPARAAFSRTRDDVRVAPARKPPSFGDMIRTAVIFAVLIFGVVALLPKGHHSNTPATPVDYAGPPQIVTARAPYHVVSPHGLGPEWTPTHVTIAVPQKGSTVTTLDLGFYVSTPEAYVHLGQSDAPNWVVMQLGKSAKQTGTTSVVASGTEVSYQTWTDSDGQPALVGAVGSSVVVINGHAPADVLRTFAAALS